MSEQQVAEVLGTVAWATMIGSFCAGLFGAGVVDLSRQVLAEWRSLRRWRRRQRRQLARAVRP